MKLTDWFPGNVKPVREGWYEIRGGDDRALFRDYFDGKNWRPFPDWQPYGKALQSTVKWRGLAEEPKEPK